MAGRPRVVRCKDSYVNHIDNNTFSGPMKMGTSPSIGVTRYYWYNYGSRCNQRANAVKKSYDNMVFLNITPAHTPVSAGFMPTCNYNYSYIAPNGVQFYDANAKYDNHYYRPYLFPAIPNDKIFMPVSKKMTGFTSKTL